MNFQLKIIHSLDKRSNARRYSDEFVFINACLRDVEEFAARHIQEDGSMFSPVVQIDVVADLAFVRGVLIMPATPTLA